MIVGDGKGHDFAGEDAFAREEASQKKLRESIDLNKQLIARSDALLKARTKTEPPNPVSS